MQTHKKKDLFKYFSIYSRLISEIDQNRLKNLIKDFKKNKKK